ncbi:multidrug resistance protein [Xylariaceae sp. FL0016]|nr:multidrug resistance protein [Xylariaceae sp. FL0016]
MVARSDQEHLPSPERRHEIDEYSAFSRAGKWFIVVLTCWASWTSNTSMFIYLPALEPLADVFHVSMDQINLSMTVYIVTLSLFLVANICLASTTSYNELIGFRALQALGQSGIILIGYAVVSDLFSPAERGFFMSVVSFAVTVGPSIGPILGGALCYTAGWSWIFWFLVANTGPCILTILLFLPETSRRIVSNGSLPQPRFSGPPLQLFSGTRRGEQRNTEDCRRPSRMPNPVRSLRILLRKDNATVVVAWSLMYAVYSCLTTTLSTLMIEMYQLTEWQAGLSYLPFALGGSFSTFLSGRLLDTTYRRTREKQGLPANRAQGDDLDTFDIEKPRVQVMSVPMMALAVCTIAYGWVLHLGVHVAVPLVLQFLTGLALQFNFSSFNVLLVDINHRSPASANASTSIVRSAFSAIAVAYVEDMFHEVGVGWSFTIFGGLCLLSLGLLTVEYSLGFKWRRESLQADSC